MGGIGMTLSVRPSVRLSELAFAVYELGGGAQDNRIFIPLAPKFFRNLGVNLLLKEQKINS